MPLAVASRMRQTLVLDPTGHRGAGRGSRSGTRNDRATALGAVAGRPCPTCRVRPVLDRPPGYSAGMARPPQTARIRATRAIRPESTRRTVQLRSPLDTKLDGSARVRGAARTAEAAT